MCSLSIAPMAASIVPGQAVALAVRGVVRASSAVEGCRCDRKVNPTMPSVASELSGMRMAARRGST